MDHSGTGYLEIRMMLMQHAMASHVHADFGSVWAAENAKADFGQVQ
jgi:hypothetical protein